MLPSCLRQGRRCELFLSPRYSAVTAYRFNASSSKDKVEKKIAKYTEQENKQNVRGYLFGRFIDYVQNYDTVLEKRFPAAMQLYRTFFGGVKEFYKDMKRFLKVTKIANDSELGLRALTRSEIECYFQTPKDMVKIAPVLLISALPFAPYVVFPVAYMYPRVLLTSHFWTLQQQTEFKLQYLRQRLTYSKAVFRCLQAKLDSVKDVVDQERMRHIFGLLGSGTHPTADEILDTKHIWALPPYRLDSLSNRHLVYLCRQHGMSAGLFKRGRLAERSYLVHHMDLAIKREGDVHNLPHEVLRNSCVLRGLNPSNLSHEQMVEWLRLWVRISEHVDGDNVSLYLHLPTLIGYNNPNNWLLIH